MLSNLRTTYPLELYNGIAWAAAADVATLQITKAADTVDTSATEAGLVLTGDADGNVDNTTFELTTGITASSPCALKAQTDAGYIEAAFLSDDISVFDLVVVGFRKIEAYNAANFAANSAALGTGDPEYTDFACFGVAGTGGKIHSLACLNDNNDYADAFTTAGDNASFKDSDVTAADSKTFIVRVEVSSAGVVTYKYANDVASTVAATSLTTLTPDGTAVKAVQHTFDAGDIIIPFVQLKVVCYEYTQALYFL